MRLARVERAFVAKHPDIPPYFRRLFSQAADAPRTRGRARAPIGLFVPKSFPVLGPWAWANADMYFRQTLAPAFLTAWESGEPAEPAERLGSPISDRR